MYSKSQNNYQMKHKITVVTAEKAENFKTDNLDFYSLDLFNCDSVDDKKFTYKNSKNN